MRRATRRASEPQLRVRAWTDGRRMAGCPRRPTGSVWLWIAPVDISAIGLYLVTGAHMVAAPHVLFLAVAAVGRSRWHRAATVA